MTYSHLFSPRAAKEYADAFDWYQQQSFLAADNLIIEVDKTIEDICKDPFRHRKTYKDLREVSLKRYPYYLIYFIDDTKMTVNILSLFHYKRSPKSKYKR